MSAVVTPHALANRENERQGFKREIAFCQEEAARLRAEGRALWLKADRMDRDAASLQRQLAALERPGAL